MKLRGIISSIGVGAVLLVGGVAGAAAEPAAATSSAGGSSATESVPLKEGIRVGDQIVYDGGQVIQNVAPMAWTDCPSNWLCLFQDNNGTGRMWQFQGPPGWQNLHSYDAGDKVTSWRNRRSVPGHLAQNSDGSGWRLTLPASSQNGNVGTPYNDNASAVCIGAIANC